jgi:oxygen-dependent protoporphyrinogen oxidase
MVTRYPRAMPQYVVGHQRRVGAIRQLLLHKSGLQLVGSGFEGVGIPECIHDGERAAKSILSALTKVI